MELVFNIEGNYKVWMRNRTNKQGGGVMFMIKKIGTVEVVLGNRLKASRFKRSQ